MGSSDGNGRLSLQTQRSDSFESLHADTRGNVTGGRFCSGRGVAAAKYGKIGRQNHEWKISDLPFFSLSADVSVYGAGMLLWEGYSSIADVWTGRKKRKGRVGDNELLVRAATTSETRIHGGTLCPGLPLTERLLLLPNPGMTNDVDVSRSWWGIRKDDGC